MNQQLTVNREYWLERNPDIEFHKVKKAYYGTHLLKINLYICGASMHYYHRHDDPKPHNINPNYDDFMTFLKRHVQAFNLQKLTKTTENRYIHVTRTPLGSHANAMTEPKLRIYDCKQLHTLHTLLKNRPDGIRLAREYDYLRIYGNDIDTMEEVVDSLYVKPEDIRHIASPGENDVGILLAGKEFSDRADKFKFKVFLKPAGKNGIPELANYLESIEHTDEVLLPKHCRHAITGPVDRWSWAYSQRSYMYAKNEDTILLIKLLAGGRYSDCIELILPSKD